MFKIIFSCVFFLFFLLAVLVGIFKGKKYVWQFSVSRILTVLVSALLAVFLSALVSWLIGGALVGVVTNLLGGVASGLIDALPTAPDAVRAIIASVISPAIFLLFFFVIKAIFGRFNGCFSELIIKLVNKIKLAIEKKKAAKAEAGAEADAVVSEEGAEVDALEADTETLEAAETADEAVEGEEPVYEKTADDEALENDAVETEANAEQAEVKAPKRKIRNKDYLCDRADKIGAVCGAFCSLFVLVIALAPFVGMLDTANSFVQVFATKEEKSVINTVVEISDGIAENAGCKTVEVLGGKLVYNGITTYPVNGKLAPISRETEYISDMVGAVKAMTNKEGDKAEAADALVATQTSFEKANITPMLVSDLFSAAADKWAVGEKFCGIACPSLGENFDPVLKEFVSVMKDSSYDTIGEDYNTVTNTVALVVKHDAAGAIKSSDGVRTIFKNEELISGIIYELLENERTVPLVEKITNVGVSVMVDGIGTFGDDEELYDDFISDMSEAYSEAMSAGEDTYSKLTALSESVATIYDEHGIDITNGVSTCIAASMIAELETGSEAEIREFFADDESHIQYLAATSETDEAIAVIDNIAHKLKKGMTKEQIAEIVKAELLAIEGVGDTLTDEELDSISSGVASDMYKDVSADNLKYKDAVFANAEEFAERTRIVFKKEMVIVSGEITDNHKEAENIARMFASAISIVDEVSAGGYDIDTIVAAFGPVLDASAATETIGVDQTARLLTVILQSEKVRDGVGMTLIQATNVSNSMSKGVVSGDTYTVLMKALGKTVEVMKISSDDGDATEAITELMQDMTPASAETLQEISTPEMVKKQGINEKSAVPVADMMSDMFGNMSTAKEEGMPEDRYEDEAKAVNDMMSIAMSANKSEEKNLFGKENSKTGITATDFVNRAADSVIISETFVNSVYGKEGGDIPKLDPLYSNRQLTESEKTELITALDAKWQSQIKSSSDKDANAEYQKVLIAIASVVNVQVEITESGVAEVMNAPDVV
ncbi:MAG: hypothetical protein J6A83_04460 [Clostridia bacterium]|nr:hypothetical protein [Clostridia bacterium]